MNKNILILALVALVAAVGIWWFATDGKSQMKLDSAEQVLVNPAAANNSGAEASSDEEAASGESTSEVTTETIVDADTGELIEVEVEVEQVQEIERVEGRLDENGVELAP